jgi:hypothetical protein
MVVQSFAFPLKRAIAINNAVTAVNMRISPPPALITPSYLLHIVLIIRLLRSPW